MGKYMRKAKITADVAVMEVSQSSLGVRTRAKTLALQRLQTSTGAATSQPSTKPGSCYLELRSRRLEKPSLLTESMKEQNPLAKTTLKDHCLKDCCTNHLSSSRLNMISLNSASGDSVSISYSKKEMASGKGTREGERELEAEDNYDLGIEASFGENSLDFGGRGRCTRESTPCSVMREAEAIGTPESTTRLTYVTRMNARNRNTMLGNVPTTLEIEEFFASAEQQQHRLFMTKYNFDIANDLPLPGRYEWTAVHPYAG